MTVPAHQSAAPSLALPWPFAPVVLLVTPDSGPASGGNAVTLTGLGLNGAVQVLFGSTPATIVGDNFLGLGLSLTVIAPPGTGTVEVTVTSASGTSNPVPYTYLGAPPPPGPPTAAGILPVSGVTTGGTPFVITGTNLTGATVTFGGAPATVVASSGTQVFGLTPPHTAGNVPVVVTTPGGTATVPGGFTYLAPPTVTGPVSPTTGVPAGGTVFTITGTNLSGATVTFGGNSATITSNTGTVITGTTPAGTVGTTVPVVVTTPGGTASAGAFTYLGVPTVTVPVTPPVGPATGGTPFTITGTNLTGATVAFGANTATITSNTGTVITGTTPAGTAGTTITVVVTTPGGTVSAGAFTYVGM